MDADLKELLTKHLSEQNEIIKKLSEQQVSQVHSPSADDLRKGKLHSIYNLLQKSHKIKDFSQTSKDVKSWINKFEEVVSSLLYGATDLNIGVESLKRGEYITLLRSKLDLFVIKELEQKFQIHEPSALKWDTVTVAQIKDLLLEQFGEKEPKISSVQRLFGPARMRKPPEMSVKNFYCSWQEKLPLCVLPNTEAEMKSFVDLIHRCAFYLSLDDSYLQKELSNIPEKDQSLQKFYTEAVSAESRRLHYQDTIAVSNSSDSSTGVSVNKTYDGASKGSSKNRRKKPWRPPSGATDAPEAKASATPTTAAVSTSNASPNPSQQRGKPPPDRKKRKPICWRCDVVGHTVHNCPDLPESYRNTQYHLNQSQNTTNKLEFQSFKVSVSQNGDPQGAQILSIDSPATVSSIELSNAVPCEESGAPFPCVDSPAIVSTVPKVEEFNVSMTRASLPIVKNLVAGVLLNGIVKCEMEIDTAACHCVLSYEVFQELVKKSGNNPPKLDAGQFIMKMADGTPSKAVKGCAYLSIARADNPSQFGTFPVMIVDGPNILLGRPALQTLWPLQYGQWSKVAEESKDALCSSCAAVRCETSCTASANAPPCVSTRQIPPPPERNEVSQEEGEAYCKRLFDAFPGLTDGKQGTFKGVEAEIHIKPGHEQFLKVLGPAKVPHGLKDEYEPKLDVMYETGNPVDGRGLKVATPVVPVVTQKNGKRKLRLCLNYKRTLNDHIEDEHYVFPTCAEQLDKLKGQFYSCLDVEGAFTQVLIKPDSRKWCTAVTHRGYLEPTRLPFGIKTAPKIFQEGMDRMIHGMDGKSPVPNTACICDDICVTGATPQEHFANLTELLIRLDTAGLKLNKEKCKFYQPSVKFLGKIIDRNGQRVDPSAVRAIEQMPPPKDKSALRSFLGHMSYVSKHIADVRSARAPLDALLKTDSKFIWTSQHEKAFNLCKKLASNTATLAHFDEKLPLVLTTDASPVGLGACLSHRVTIDGKTFLKPISFASCALKGSERNYAQIDREGLAVHWATKYYRQFLYCRKFELHTDCSALTRIFGSKNDLGGCATSRLNRWAAALMEYDFTASHIKGANNKVCDSLSRLPVPAQGELQVPSPTGVGQPVTIDDLSRKMSVKHIDYEDVSAQEAMTTASCLSLLPDPDETHVSICKIVADTTAVWDILPLTVKDVARATIGDRTLGKLLSAVRSGQINKNDPDLKPYMSVFEDLHIEQGVVLHGARIIVPAKQRLRLLSELHMTHIGVVKMKEVAREYFWWPGISKEIEDIAKSCNGCNKFRRKPAPAPLCPWPFARRPMERVHIDYCEYKGKQLLVMIDAYSKYIWTHVMNADTTTLKTLAVLYGWFCETNGFPTTLVSDNGPQFTSHEFAGKMKKWGIKHILTPPYHPASNGLAEKAVHIVKDKLKKMNAPANPIDLFVTLQAALRAYRATPHCSTGQTPFQLIASAPVQVMFPLLQLSEDKSQVTKRSASLKDNIRTARKFRPGDKVLVYDTQSKLNSQGVIQKVKSNNSYLVSLNDSVKHISGDHIRLMSEDSEIDNANIENKEIYSNLDYSEIVNDHEDCSTSEDYNDSSDDEFLSTPIGNAVVQNPVARRRGHRKEAEKLIDSLSQPTPPTRLRTRSGRN